MMTWTTFHYSQAEIELIQQLLALNDGRISSVYLALPKETRAKDTYCVIELIERIKSGWEGPPADRCDKLTITP